MKNDWQTASIVKIHDQTPDFRTLILKPQKLHKFKSGNFVELAARRGRAFKCYSVVTSPTKAKDTIEVGVKLFRNGELSPHLFMLKKSARLLMRGPTGTHFVWEQSNRRTVLLAGGSGICPMVSILRQFVPNSNHIHLLYSAKEGSVYYESELSKLCSKKRIDYTLVQTGREARINKKFLLEKVGKLINANTDFYIAGPTGFVQSASFWLTSAGVKPENLKTDDFGAD